MKRLALLAVVATLEACTGRPRDEDVVKALQSRFAILNISNFERVNGTEYPAGGGAPRRYAVQYTAILTSQEPVTFTLSSGLEKAVEKGALIKDVQKGFIRDPTGLAVFADIGSELWRTDESRPAKILGTVSFIKTENGWTTEEVRAYLPEDFYVLEPSMGYREPGVTAVQQVYREAMISDLRNLQSQQEVYQSNPANGHTYASSTSTLDFATLQGVQVQITTASASGWAARASHVGLPGVVCSIYVGVAPPPQQPADAPGKVTCSK